MRCGSDRRLCRRDLQRRFCVRVATVASDDKTRNLVQRLWTAAQHRMSSTLNIVFWWRLSRLTTRTTLSVFAWVATVTVPTRPTRNFRFFCFRYEEHVDLTSPFLASTLATGVFWPGENDHPWI